LNTQYVFQWNREWQKSPEKIYNYHHKQEEFQEKFFNTSRRTKPCCNITHNMVPRIMENLCSSFWCPLSFILPERERDTKTPWSVLGRIQWRGCQAKSCQPEPHKNPHQRPSRASITTDRYSENCQINIIFTSYWSLNIVIWFILWQSLF